MSTVKVNRSLKRIISSKKKVLEIQHVIASKRIKDSTVRRVNNDSKAVLASQVMQNYESAIQKLSLIESCITGNEYTIINLLRDDRFEELTVKEIYDELFIDFQRELTVPNQYTQMAKTG